MTPPSLAPHLGTSRCQCAQH